MPNYQETAAKRLGTVNSIADLAVPDPRDPVSAVVEQAISVARTALGRIEVIQKRISGVELDATFGDSGECLQSDAEMLLTMMSAIDNALFAILQTL